MRKKSPITYYGGKFLMLPHILPLFPKHNIYVEAFAGGLSVFWGKEPSNIEVINDTNREVINFYQQLNENFEPLQKKVLSTLHSRSSYKDAMIIYKNPHLFTPLMRAWAFWVATSQSYCSSIGAGFSYSSSGKNRAALTLFNKRKNFIHSLKERLELVTIENDDANNVIKRYDGEDTLVYLDPPYIDTNQGHYSGYKETDMELLLKTCSFVKGKFILSSYQSKILSEYTFQNKWRTILIEKTLSIQAKNRKRIEVLTMNF